MCTVCQRLGYSAESHRNYYIPPLTTETTYRKDRTGSINMSAAGVPLESLDKDQLKTVKDNAIIATNYHFHTHN